MGFEVWEGIYKAKEGKVLLERWNGMCKDEMAGKGKDFSGVGKDSKQQI